MIFVDYLSAPFAKLANNKQTILSATSNVLVVNSIIVCNLGGQNIRFNLQKVRGQATPIEIYYLNELEIKAYQTIDVIKELGFNVFLQYQQTPTISDSLVCFSKGLNQKFDCEVCYSKLNEAPYSM